MQRRIEFAGQDQACVKTRTVLFQEMLVFASPASKWFGIGFTQSDIGQIIIPVQNVFDSVLRRFFGQIGFHGEFLLRYRLVHYGRLLNSDNFVREMCCSPRKGENGSKTVQTIY